MEPLPGKASAAFAAPGLQLHRQHREDRGGEEAEDLDPGPRHPADAVEPSPPRTAPIGEPHRDGDQQRASRRPPESRLRHRFPSVMASRTIM